jgi:hypothetical protein
MRRESSGVTLVLFALQKWSQANWYSLYIVMAFNQACSLCYGVKLSTDTIKRWCFRLPEDAGLCQPKSKKAPGIRGLGHLECYSLPAIAGSRIIPTRSSPAASPKYHKQRD